MKPIRNDWFFCQRKNIRFFAEGEDTPEVVHEHGLKYVNEILGKNFEVVIATHFNTDNENIKDKKQLR